MVLFQGFRNGVAGLALVTSMTEGYRDFAAIVAELAAEAFPADMAAPAVEAATEVRRLVLRKLRRVVLHARGARGPGKFDASFIFHLLALTFCRKS